MHKKLLIAAGLIVVLTSGIIFIQSNVKNSTVPVMAQANEIDTEQEQLETSTDSLPETPSESLETPIESLETPEPTNIPQSTETENTNESDEEAHQEAETPKETTANDELADITPLDKTMYAKGNINTRTGPSTEYTKAGNLTLNESVHVTGQSQSTAWYQLTLPSGEIVYCSNQLLSDTKTEVQQPTNNSNNNGTQTNNNQQTNNNVQTPQPEQPSTPPTNNQDTPSAGGIEQGNLGGDNGFDSIIDIGKGSDWLGTGNEGKAH